MYTRVAPCSLLLSPAQASFPLSFLSLLLLFFTGSSRHTKHTTRHQLKRLPHCLRLASFITASHGSPRRSSSRLAGWLAFKLKPTQRSNPSPNAAAHSQIFLSFSGSKPETSVTAAAKKNEEETTIT